MKVAAEKVSAHLVIIGVHCKYCRQLVSHSIASKLGTEANGYVCPNCLAKEQSDFVRLGRELREASTVRVEVPGDPHPCVMCNDASSDQYRLVHIDGRLGFVCLRCEPKWVLKNRSHIGPELQHRLKLK